MRMVTTFLARNSRSFAADVRPASEADRQDHRLSDPAPNGLAPTAPDRSKANVPMGPRATSARHRAAAATMDHKLSHKARRVTANHSGAPTARRAGRVTPTGTTARKVSIAGRGAGHSEGDC